MQFSFSGPKSLLKDLAETKPSYRSRSSHILDCVMAGIDVKRENSRWQKAAAAARKSGGIPRR